LIPALLVAMSAGAAFAQPAPQAQPAEPPEEDETRIAKEYAFNPLQAAKEVMVGKQYFKKGSYRAAAMRFEEALKWNSNDAEAWLRLGDARNKMRDKKGAREAWKKYVELGSDSKQVEEIKKKLAGKP
jgi:tetratricopeptide (TPR) repeat protein